MVGDINQPGVDQFLVKALGMKKRQDVFMFPRISYWAPEANDVIETLIYRIGFPEETESLHLQGISECWDFSREPSDIPVASSWIARWCLAGGIVFRGSISAGEIVKHFCEVEVAKAASPEAEGVVAFSGRWPVGRLRVGLSL